MPEYPGCRELLSWDSKMNTKPTPGCFLLSTPVLEGSFFQNRIVFLADYGRQGSYGLIVNQPLRIPLDEVFPGAKLKERKNFPFFLGGPVQEEMVQILQVGQSTWEEASEVVPGVFLHTLESGRYLLTELFDQPQTRIFLGYSGWAVNQLEAEIQQGCWEVLHSPDPLDVFGLPREHAFGTPADFKKQFVLL